MQQIYQTSRITLIKHFLKENWIRILSILLFILFICVSVYYFFRRIKSPSDTLEKIREKIHELKDETQDINIDRRIIKEIRKVEILNTVEKSAEYIEELKQINESTNLIADFEERMNKKVKLYAKIN